jgi:hypothetical protein
LWSRFDKRCSAHDGRVVVSVTRTI